MGCELKWLKLHIKKKSSDRPLIDALGGLQEAGVVILLQRVVSLCDEGRGAFNALLAVGDLLRQLAEPLRLPEVKKQKKQTSQEGTLEPHRKGRRAAEHWTVGKKRWF